MSVLSSVPIIGKNEACTVQDKREIIRNWYDRAEGSEI